MDLFGLFDGGIVYNENSFVVIIGKDIMGRFKYWIICGFKEF